MFDYNDKIISQLDTWNLINVWKIVFIIQV